MTITVFDDVFPDPESISKKFDGMAWVFGWKSHPAVDKFSFFHRHFAGPLHSDHYKPDDGAYVEFSPEFLAFEQLWYALKDKFVPGHRLVRCYANAMPYGCDGTPHTDSVNPLSHTLVYYPARNWQPAWGGETVFLTDDRKDIIQSVFPKPNRLVAFSGVIPHLARGPTRYCPEMRVTLMFKTVAPDAS